jgi:hypothetical protein
MQRRGNVRYLLLSFALLGVTIIAAIAIFGIEPDESFTRGERLAVGIVAMVGLNLAGAWALARYLRSLDEMDR